MGRSHHTRNAILRNDPFAEFDLLRSWPFGAPRRRLVTSSSEEADANLGWSPRVNVHEDEETYSLVVEVPGVDPDDITVECHERVLTVKGEKKQEFELDEGRHHKLERRFGAFSRSFKLPKDADEEAVRASHKNGVLTIAVSKAAAAQPRVVAIDS